MMAEYARAMRPDPGLRARVGAQVENRGRRREPARWAPLAAAVVALLLITTFMLVRQSTNRQPAATPTFTSFTTPSRGSMPAAIVAGPDGAMWFAETSVARIGRIDEGGTASEYPLSNPNAAPTSIAAGPDGALWFTESGANQIGRIGVDGHITEFRIPTPNAIPQSITAGRDGNLWFTELAGNKIGRLTVRGDITEFELPQRQGAQCGYLCPYGIASASDGALWFTESQLSPGGGNRIGRLTTDGKLTEYEIPTLNAVPTCIVAVGDRIYACESRAGKLAEVTMTGRITEHSVPGAAEGAAPVAAAAGSGGSVWFLVGKQFPGAAGGGQQLARAKADGSIDLFALPDSDTVGAGVAVDRSGSVWLLAGTDRILRFQLK